MLRTTRAEAPLPEWESVARDEEDFAVQAASRAEHWRTLAGRARHRALRIREERCLDTTGDERSMDVHMAERLRLDSTAKARREAMNTSPVSLSRRVLRLLRRDST